VLVATGLPFFPPHIRGVAHGVAAFVLLFLSIAAIIWPKFVCLVATMWRHPNTRVLAVVDFACVSKGRVHLDPPRHDPEGARHQAATDNAE
jgi:hypothetical protein